eukprot:CAMPEP_0185334028 /NCGR_PEP_ID=MMETSP1363-20130426/84549_1 /TAXON_ID=38817 /ORGANISM="Gephyrocapsa oceanica, Strain RCC1303" /LENGTH=50 /DNA_ID=CAMNT_0027932991 /DNA_START=14 /DNA_END=163 /DNA_ORIENTATION=+
MSSRRQQTRCRCRRLAPPATGRPSEPPPGAVSISVAEGAESRDGSPPSAA